MAALKWAAPKAIDAAHSGVLGDTAQSIAKALKGGEGVSDAGVGVSGAGIGNKCGSIAQRLAMVQ